MRFLKFSLKITLFLLLPFSLITSCKDDDEPTPDTATIHGTITLENASLWDTWKDSGEVQLTIFPEFVLALPPAGAGWGVVPDGFFGAGIPGGTFPLGAPWNAQNPLVATWAQGVNQLEYELTVDPGTYSALALGLRHNTITDPNLRTATLGVHWGNPNTTSHGVTLNGTPFSEPAPSTITVEKGDNVEINFKADFAILPLWFQ